MLYIQQKNLKSSQLARRLGTHTWSFLTCSIAVTHTYVLYTQQYTHKWWYRLYIMYACTLDTHTHTRTHTHTLTHAHTHTHTHTRTHTRTHKRTHSQTHTHAHTQAHTQAHTTNVLLCRNVVQLQTKRQSLVGCQ